jgi:chorismate dehydratase
MSTPSPGLQPPSFTLGVVSYLNALPLYRTLETRGEVAVVRVVPSQLAAMLESGRCDAAIMPVVDFLRGTGEAIIGDACIGTKNTGDGAVRSVLLFHRAPLERLKSVAVDTSSHSSVALLRVLLADGYGVLPPFVPHAPNLAQMLQQHEAALIIGDAALEATRGLDAGVQVLDLGVAWKKLTGLPFVFAAWIARHGLGEAARAELGRILSAARDEGMENLEAVVSQNPITTTLSKAEVAAYLREAIEPRLSPEHRAAIEEFRRRAEKYDLLKPRD